MINNIDSDLIGQLNRLLEQLHQKGGNNQGSTINLTYVAPGAQYVNHIDTQIFGADKSQKQKTASSSTSEPPQLPAPLATPEAMVLWKKAQKAGLVDENFQPTLSRSQAALLADAMATRLGIKEKWKVFEKFWNRNNMYNDYYRAMEQQQSLAFQDELKQLFC